MTDCHRPSCTRPAPPRQPRTATRSPAGRPGGSGQVCNEEPQRPPRTIQRRSVTAPLRTVPPACLIRPTQTRSHFAVGTATQHDLTHSDQNATGQNECDPPPKIAIYHWADGASSRRTMRGPERGLRGDSAEDLVRGPRGRRRANRRTQPTPPSKHDKIRRLAGAGSRPAGQLTESSAVASNRLAPLSRFRRGARLGGPRQWPSPLGHLKIA